MFPDTESHSRRRKVLVTVHSAPDVVFPTHRDCHRRMVRNNWLRRNLLTRPILLALPIVFSIFLWPGWPAQRFGVVSGFLVPVWLLAVAFRLNLRPPPVCISTAADGYVYFEFNQEHFEATPLGRPYDEILAEFNDEPLQVALIQRSRGVGSLAAAKETQVDMLIAKSHLSTAQETRDALTRTSDDLRNPNSDTSHN